jgi:peroxiredoxin
VKPGDRAPDFTLQQSGGGSVKLSSLKGTVVVLDFWASWCVPCKKELPALETQAKKWAEAGQKVVVVGVGLDKDRENGEKLVRQLGLKAIKILWDPDGKVPAAYDIPTMPTSVVIDARGIVKHVHAGFASGDEKKLAAEVEALLGSSK